MSFKNFGAMTLVLALFAVSGCNSGNPGWNHPGGPWCPTEPNCYYGPLYLQQYLQSTYQLSEQNAALLAQYYGRVSQGDWASLMELGFSSEDIQALQRGEMPSETSLAALAERMGMTSAQVTTLLQALRADFLN